MMEVSHKAVTSSLVQVTDSSVSASIQKSESCQVFSSTTVGRSLEARTDVSRFFQGSVSYASKTHCQHCLLVNRQVQASLLPMPGHFGANRNLVVSPFDLLAGAALFRQFQAAIQPLRAPAALEIQIQRLVPLLHNVIELVQQLEQAEVEESSALPLRIAALMQGLSRCFGEGVAGVAVHHALMSQLQGLRHQLVSLLSCLCDSSHLMMESVVDRSMHNVLKGVLASNPEIDRDGGRSESIASEDASAEEAKVLAQAIEGDAHVGQQLTKTLGQLLPLLSDVEAQLAQTKAMPVDNSSLPSALPSSEDASMQLQASADHHVSNNEHQPVINVRGERIAAMYSDISFSIPEVFSGVTANSLMPLLSVMGSTASLSQLAMTVSSMTMATAASPAALLSESQQKQLPPIVLPNSGRPEDSRRIGGKKKGRGSQDDEGENGGGSENSSSFTDGDEDEFFESPEDDD